MLGDRADGGLSLFDRDLARDPTVGAKHMGVDGHGPAENGRCARANGEGRTVQFQDTLTSVAIIGSRVLVSAEAGLGVEQVSQDHHIPLIPSRDVNCLCVQQKGVN